MHMCTQIKIHANKPTYKYIYMYIIVSLLFAGVQIGVISGVYVPIRRRGVIVIVISDLRVMTAQNAYVPCRLSPLPSPLYP
jgi:hypothetical protein